MAKVFLAVSIADDGRTLNFNQTARIGQCDHCARRILADWKDLLQNLNDISAVARLKLPTSAAAGMGHPRTVISGRAQSSATRRRRLDWDSGGS